MTPGRAYLFFRHSCSAAVWLLVGLSLFFPAPSAHGASKQERNEEKQAIQQELSSYRIKIERLQQRINSQKAQSEEAVLQEKGVLEEIEEIDKLLETQLNKVGELELQVRQQQELIDVKEQEIALLQADKEKVQSHLKKRIYAYYRMGKIGFLNVAFSTNSLPDLLNFHEAFQEMITYDQAILAEYKVKIDDLKQARQVYVLEKELLQDFIDTALEEQLETDRLRNEKRALLTHIRTRKQLYDRAILEMEEATETLSTTLVNLKNKQQNLEQEFKHSKGDLPPPVAGTVITTFNQEKANKLGITRKAPGIAILAKDGTKVKAVADGEVIFSGYLRGYGNTVIIDHGYNYHTVTSRLGKLLKNKGENVKTGTAIGLVSDTAMLIDEGLYFEIRHDKNPQNPLKWLKTSQLRIAEQLP